jgi:type II secretory pathway pseudopilin PulG
MHILAKKPRSTASGGFTIVETLIVLVIAGLILLFVFEAIPALTRSSRNNQRKQDIQAILEVISNYELNNSGNFPYCGYSTYPSCFGSTSSSLLYYIENRLTYYTNPNQVIIRWQQNTNSAQPSSYATTLSSLPSRIGLTAADQVDFYNYEKCAPNNLGGTTTIGAGYNDVVALYALETGNNTIAGECEQL